ncbi:thioredoxin-dependent thiol peroxidase [Varunaivibrio sulfuroxidans]|uniref:thioredoxin-dependent peroxiredoxin n=1 Tax=Varunaivibrio sulfuroxidans TaxID=1773489 RepID=A0A4R3J8J1_9PROT|nr:thioredoxin-dependent thiol peroxidase [Varunaivibrio sulfuroxidans]TCS62158.1 peroxiredoxin Q/BCP [Varunaivibrio sulfuroxidans]WES30587.1 thioredoxin-dependent thiol peroxidase [Varunaivibrio sulfuroxidans]
MTPNPVTLNPGDPAPDVTLLTDNGHPLSLAELKGKKVVLYFYPKDSTPGCTQEGADFRDLHDAFTARGVVVLGASKDSVKRHQNFKAKHGFTFPLLSDEDGALCEAYGVWVLKKNYGRQYMGIERTTFLINEAGILEKIWRKVKVKGHAQEVLDAVTA